MNSADRRPQAVRWLGPSAAWALIMCELAGVVALGVAASGNLRFGGALALAATMLLTLAFGLVGVGRESPLIRLVAGAAFMFLALMFFLGFADLVTRVRYWTAW
ncbi:MAG: hypothetical protein JO288_17415 [Hyphomicrobiales bacterium]|nr:hypothetical protein [Hyphomicrobiales bacterium]